VLLCIRSTSRQHAHKLAHRWTCALKHAHTHKQASTHLHTAGKHNLCTRANSQTCMCTLLHCRWSCVQERAYACAPTLHVYAQKSKPGTHKQAPVHVYIVLKCVRAAYTGHTHARATQPSMHTHLQYAHTNMYLYTTRRSIHAHTQRAHTHTHTRAIQPHRGQHAQTHMAGICIQRRYRRHEAHVCMQANTRAGTHAPRTPPTNTHIGPM
jgi:hypothetical protein